VANPYHDGPVTDHFDGRHFFVPGHPWRGRPLDLLRWQFNRKAEPWPRPYPSPHTDKPPSRVEGERLRLGLIGHASFLLQCAGRNILIDPVYSERTSPYAFIGPKRVNPPGIAFDDLPPIDIVLISHNHYDHLDAATLERLHRRDRPLFVTPLGNGSIISGGDASVQVREYDWGDAVSLAPGLRLHLEPCHHWSARGLFDRRKALWAAFVIETPAGKLYHIADTGYRDGALFRDIPRKHGPIRLATLPIGAYEPRWFMAPQHINPAESVRIMQDCGAEEAIGHHWGTFRLTDEGIERPIEALKAALDKAAIDPRRFQPFRPGQVFEISAS
jgi:L-ascorbate metabolism protein UlaG (beta-lactamase superfamily)